MSKPRRRRGIWKLVDGNPVRFELDRKNGLRVHSPRRLVNKVICFNDLADVAEGQFRMNL